MESSQSSALIELLNESEHFQFKPIDQRSKADLGLIDWRSSQNRSSQQQTNQITSLGELPVLVVSGDNTDLWSVFETTSSLDYSHLEFTYENEIGSFFLDTRIRKLLLTHRQISTERLFKSNAEIMLNAVMKHSNDWMVIKAADHKFMHVSKKFCHFTEMPPEDIIGKNDLEIGTSPELVLGKPGTDWKGFWALDQEAFKNGEHVILQPVVLDENNFEETRETTDKVPLRDSSGNVFALLVCVAELSQNKSLHSSTNNISDADIDSMRFWEIKKNLNRSPALTQMNNEKKRIEALNAESKREFTAKNQFIASASHDLRQPLHALGLYLRMLEEIVDGDSVYLVDRIKQCTEALNDLLNSLLDISKLDANVISAEMSSFSSDDLLRSLCDECHSIARGKSLDLSCSSDGSQVYSDPVLLRRVIRNLVINAINYTDEGKVSVTAIRVGNHVHIVVSDTGIGIPEEMQEVVFEEFEKLEAHTQNSPHIQQGLGLGLSIVKRLCRLLDIEIGLQSTVGKGTRVTAKVPLGQSLFADLDDLTTVLDRGAPTGLMPNSSGANKTDKLILIIDDEQLVCEAVETVLAHSGYRTISATSPEQALEKIRTSNLIPDALLVDFRLSEDMTGLDAIKIINTSLGASTPAMIVTGDTTKDGLKEITNSGYKHLHKPVDVDELLELVRKTVETTHSNE